MYHWNNVTLIAILFVCPTLFLVSCSSNGETDSRVVEHPIPGLIPYHEREHISIERDYSFGDLTDPNEGIKLLNRYLVDPDQMEVERLEVEVKDGKRLKAVPMRDERLVLLDTSTDRLTEYNLTTNSSELLANFGRGPGELQHSIDLERVGDYLYVARRDMRLSLFKCSDTCIYDKTIVLDVQPLSIASTESGLLMAVGLMIGGGEYAEKESIIESSPFQIVSRETGQLIDEFGSIYKTRFKMVLARFNRTSIVGYLNEQGKYVAVSSWFPYVYIYNENFEIEETYKIDNHIQNTFEFNSAEQRRTFPVKDHTLISEMKVMNDGRILLLTTTRTNRREKEGETVHDYRYDYYVIDHSIRDTFHIGTDSHTSAYQQMLFPVGNQLIKNDGGILYHIK